MPVLYFDEDVRFAVAPSLRALQYDVRTTLEEGRLGARDANQLRFAADNGLLFVTCNRRDFHSLHEAWLDWSQAWGVSRDHGGILALDQGHPVSRYIAALMAFLAADPIVSNHLYDWSATTNAWTLYRPRRI